MHKSLFVSLALVLFLPGAASAAIPLITDDTGTQGKGRFQFELFGQYGSDGRERITSKTADMSATLTYGITDPLDIILSLPFHAWRTEESGSITKGHGISDVAMEAKWKFYEQDGVSFALKPGFTLPTGNDDKGLGAGKATYHLFMIATTQMKPWQFDLNVGYLLNDNTVSARKNIWSASLDAQVEVLKDLRLAVDMGATTNPGRSSNTPAAYILGGLIYSLSKNLDIGLGVKGSLTKPETDISIRGGITWRL